ncbi:MAG: phytoene desaturase family protein [Candidatus Zixiibacteriota bacterium]
MGKKVIVIGAGPGGLTNAMILQHRGFDVEIYEKDPVVGGRNQAIKLGDFIFDMGPTFLMMKNILEDMFKLAGRKIEDYLDIKEVDPMYRLAYHDGREFFPSHKDQQKTYEQIKKLFPGNEEGYWRLLKREKQKYDKLVPCLQVPYDRYTDFFSKRFIKALPYLDAHVSLFDVLGRYYSDDDLKIAFTFQAKYLGMSPWECPGTFTIISYIEHNGGIYHPIGGLNEISHQMAKILEEDGGKIHLSSPVKKVSVENGKANGIILENGDFKESDYVVVNADFGYAINNLFDSKDLKKWKPEKIHKKKFSCSTFMLYLGVDKVYDIPHNNIVFAEDYKKNVDEIAVSGVLSEDPSVYIQNAVATDPTLAPEGQSTIYLLVPIANNQSNIDWDKDADGFRDKVLDIVENRGKLTGLREHIVEEKMITPAQWENELNVYRGATFNLAHNVGQMLIFRPHNKFEDVENVYLVGGGTHPGSGLPTIYESGRISADIMTELAK